jgi:hypothetical protein
MNKRVWQPYFVDYRNKKKSNLTAVERITADFMEYELPDNKKYDSLLCNQVLEHVPQPALFMKNSFPWQRYPSSWCLSIGVIVESYVIMPPIISRTRSYWSGAPRMSQFIVESSGRKKIPMNSVGGFSLCMRHNKRWWLLVSPTFTIMI